MLMNLFILSPSLRVFGAKRISLICLIKTQRDPFRFESELNDNGDVSAVALLRYLQQEVPEGHERGPVFRFGAPALQHDVVGVLRTVLRLAQPLGLHVHLVEDLQTDK